MRVLVRGAGIIGLAVAEELLLRGHRVRVVDPAPCSGASGVAAGLGAAGLGAARGVGSAAGAGAGAGSLHASSRDALASSKGRAGKDRVTGPLQRAARARSGRRSYLDGMA